MRLVGVEIPDNKQIFIALTYIYGIGKTSSFKILSKANVDPFKKASELTEEEKEEIKKIIEKEYKIEGDLKREIAADIKRLKEISCYRGQRHKANLPVRGQRTRTNARTKRGKRVTVGSGKKKPPAPK